MRRFHLRHTTPLNTRMFPPTTASNHHAPTHLNRRLTHACVPSPSPSTISFSEPQSTSMPSIPSTTTCPLFLRKGVIAPCTCRPERAPLGIPGVEREVDPAVERVYTPDPEPTEDDDPALLVTLLVLLPPERLCA